MLLVAGMLAPGLAHASDAPSCALQEARFVCTANDDRGAMAALAAEATRSNLLALRRQGPRFDDRAERERFRHSVEAARMRARRHARRVARLRRRGRTDDATYRSMRQTWDQALANYRLAIDLYERAIWRDPLP